MDDFPGLLARDYGFRAQGKAAPMAASKGTSGGNLNFGMGSGGDGRTSSFSSSSRGKSNWNSTPTGSSFLDDDGLFKSSGSQKNHDSDGLGGYNDVYGGPPKYTNQSNTRNSATFDYDAVFQGSKSSSGAKLSSLPVYDKPVYDDDIFDGVPGMKSTSSVKYDDVFSSISSPPKQNDHFDDFLGNLDRKKSPESKHSFPKTSEVKKDVSDFDDLIPGFGGSSPPKDRKAPEASQSQKPTAPFNKSTNVMEDPFVIIEPGSVPPYETSEIFDDPLEQVNKLNKPTSTTFNGSPDSGVFNDLNPLDDFANSVPSFSSGPKNRVENKSPPPTGATAPSTRRAAGKEPTEDSFFRTANNVSPKVEISPNYEVKVDSVDDIWITVSEVPLFTQPTSAPPPSRPPPPRPVQGAKAGEGSLPARNAKEKISQYSSFQHFSPSFQSPTTVPSSVKSTGVSSIDELEDFAMGRSRDPTDDPADVLSGEEEVDTAAAVKEAMDKAEARFKHAREVRERESVRTGKSKEAGQQEKDEKASRDAQEQELREKQERLDREREQREREEKEREQKRLEKEEQRARQAVERATREVRERAVAEARAKAQRAAVEKATAEARERHERAAVQRAVNEARERTAKEAREKLERAAAEARERSNAEAKEKAAAVARAEAEVKIRAERASVERATAEARERVSAEARERASASTRHTQQNNENDLESFFGARPSSAPRPNRTSTSDSAFDSQFQNRPVPEGARRTPSGTSSTIRKASSTTNIVDDLTSIFGGTSVEEFQEMDGESEERRRARLERQQRTQERAAKALAEKNERDRQVQREQAERNRMSETLDIEIKRWSAGKEGNLRALLSTLQYVLWPECGWQPVSLTDLITGAAVKKVYRKATLCIHPDKVQQKGANLQQKYIAEKVFDLLKEAWNKLNSEELF
ncbi:Auxilin-related protein [Thalictrum thalictroides]|uniref:Auxilin-related protein n=1 Tax=Thalictrum thalictroides TaxID=46969 RepID=A0A7J6XEX6_THATH|nr:Auxilin-related protein [Thalictrum thalictroides]